MRGKEYRRFSVVLILIAILAGINEAYAATVVSVEPSAVVDDTLQSGSSFAVDVDITDGVDVYSWQVNMTWDPSMLNVTGYTPSDFLQGNPNETFASHPYEYDQPRQERNPSTYYGIANWTNPDYAYLDDSNYAKNDTADIHQVYGNYGFDTGAMTSVGMLEVGVKAKIIGSGLNDYIDVRVSNDGGITWGGNHTVNVFESEVLSWVDVTDDFSWTPSDLSNANFRLKITYKKVSGGKNEMIFVNWLPVYAYDILTIENPVRALDKDLDSFAFFNYSERDGEFKFTNFTDTPLSPSEEHSTVVRVDFKMKFSANASALGDQYRIIYYVPVFNSTAEVLVDWTSAATPLGTYEWIDAYNPNFGEAWTWGYVGVIQFAVETKRGTGDPTAGFRLYEAWVEVQYEKPTTGLQVRLEQDAGWALFSDKIIYPYPGTTGSGRLVTVDFKVLDYGSTELIINQTTTSLIDSELQEITSVTKLNGYFRNKYPGDVDGDKYVGSADAGVLNGAYGQYSWQPFYDRETDFDLDGYVGSADAGVLNGAYGTTYP